MGDEEEDPVREVVKYLNHSVPVGEVLPVTPEMGVVLVYHRVELSVDDNVHVVNEHQLVETTFRDHLLLFVEGNVNFEIKECLEL